MYRILIALVAFDDMNDLGGHYFSALVTANELAKDHKLTIFIIGDFVPKTFDHSNINIVFNKYNPNWFRLCPKNIEITIDRINPDIVIAFDEKSGSILRFLSARKKLGFIQVKAGGPIPVTPLQKNPFQVHFSKRDFEIAQKRINYKHKLIAWIPNRVENHNLDLFASNQLKNISNSSSHDIIIIRIGRIEERYEDAFVAAINSAKIMRDSGYKVKLFMIGAVTHQDVENKINKLKNENDFLLTERIYTQNAKRFLGAAQINLGVGRGFMEGCAAGNHMLAMAGENDLPVVVSNENFHELFSENFSLRSNTNSDDGKRKNELIRLASKVADGQRFSELSFSWFDQYFSSEKLCDLYKPILYAAFCRREKVDFNVFSNYFIFMFKSILGKRKLK